MDEYSSAVASRRSWSKSLQQKQRGGLSQRKEHTLTLPVLARRPSGLQVGAGSRTSSLHAFLASQLENNERESYSRSQLRAMASSKLQASSNNNVASSNPRVHERLTPLDPTSLEKARPQQRRPLPGHLQAAINEVLATRNPDEALSDREDSCTDSSTNYEVPETPAIPRVKRSSPCKTQLQGRRPEWRRYIRRIMLTKGIRGSTLARYRRLVGIVARKNLSTSFAGAVERVVRYRLEFRSAVMIQRKAHQFLHRRRQAKELRRRRAAARIQLVWRRAIAIEKQRKQAETARLAALERLTQRSAARTIRRAYRTYQSTCALREEELRQLQQASKLQRARLKLLRRYQSWHQNASKRTLDREPDDAASITIRGVGKSIVSEAVASPGEPSDASSIAARDCVQAESTCASISSDEIACPEHSSTSPEVPHDEIVDTKNVFAPSAQLPSKTDEYLGGHKSTSSDDVDSQQQSDQPSQNLDDLTVRVSFEENQAILGDCTPVDSPILDNQADLLPCKEQQSPEINTPGCAFKDEPQDDNHSPHEVDTPAELSTPADHLPILDNSVEDTSELAALAATERQTLAGKRIARNLHPKVQARHGIKTHAAIRIQCFIRSLLAKKYLVCMRLTALHSLRAQLLASWHQVDLKAQSSLADNQPEEILYDPEIDDEEDDFDVEMHGCQPHNHSVSDNYLHLLPTRNGQIPPGVPLLQSSAGAPLLSLWKWSWPGERWLSNGQ
ncbi:uncharacterized protein KRP23_4311 [Phytophthora ramorum]|uniref:uncharacterized protein n=1 Tax=Phytophthora ramorum TaxID=164328 RepID=UPI003098C9EA|nr:hypothetical protein KRP23_4311 [Phytophthora ramorum]